jgi:hypothetical protein
MFSVVWTIGSLDLRFIHDTCRLFTLPANSPAYVLETPIGYALVNPLTLQSGLVNEDQLQKLVYPTLFGFDSREGNPRHFDQEYRHNIIGDGTFVQGRTTDDLITVHGKLFFTCQESVLHVNQETNDGVKCYCMELNTVVFGSGTRWFRTDQIHPFDPTDCRIGTESLR